MSWLRRDSNQPLWKEEFPVRTADERYVTRRQLTKFLVLTSFGMFVGNLWILFRSLFQKMPSYPSATIAQLDDLPIGQVKLFAYPNAEDHCILIRTTAEEYVAYSQKCTHLSCAVYYSQENNCLECPCHRGFFSVENGEVLEGPPSRPLPRVILEKHGSQLVATGMRA